MTQTRRCYPYDPQWIMPAGEMILHAIDDMDLTMKEAAERTGIEAFHLKDLICGVARVTEETSARLARLYWDDPPDGLLGQFLRYQEGTDATIARFDVKTDYSDWKQAGIVQEMAGIMEACQRNDADAGDRLRLWLESKWWDYEEFIRKYEAHDGGAKVKCAVCGKMAEIRQVTWDTGTCKDCDDWYNLLKKEEQIAREDTTDEAGHLHTDEGGA